MPRHDQDDFRGRRQEGRWREDDDRDGWRGRDEERSWDARSGGSDFDQGRQDQGRGEGWRGGQTQGHSTYGRGYGANEQFDSARRSNWRDEQRYGDSGWTASESRGRRERSSTGQGDWGRGGYPQGGYGQSGYGGDFGQEGARQRSLGGTSGAGFGANPALDRAARGDDERGDLGFLPNRAPWARDRDDGDRDDRGLHRHGHHRDHEHSPGARGWGERVREFGERITGREDDQNHDHEPDYLHWRNRQLSNYDQDYARWRDEQARKHDEEYRSFRDQRRSQFHSSFDDWRTRRQASQSGGQEQGGGSENADQNPAGRQSFGGFQSFSAGGSDMSQGMSRTDLEPAGSTTGHQFVGHGSSAESVADGRGGYGRADASALDKGFSNTGSSEGTQSAAGPGAGEEDAGGGETSASSGGVELNPHLSAVSDGRNKAEVSKRSETDEDASRH
jgi:hypothetical protein